MRAAVEDATLEHVYVVIEDIRSADHAEWYAGTGKFFEDAVVATFKSGDAKRVAIVDGLPMCFWGWDADGNVWMFATEAAEKKAIALHRILHRVLAEMPPVLKALADNRNVAHHRWLRWLGFEPVEVQFIAPFGLPFTLYTRRRP